MISVSVFYESKHLRSTIIYGTPDRKDSVSNGSIAHFSDNAFVLYQLTARQVQTFLIRGLGDVAVPGVTPAVNLVAHAHNATESRRLVHSIRWLDAHQYAPDTLSDGLWLRISALLNRKNYGVKDLRLLLAFQT